MMTSAKRLALTVAITVTITSVAAAQYYTAPYGDAVRSGYDHPAYRQAPNAYNQPANGYYGHRQMPDSYYGQPQRHPVSEGPMHFDARTGQWVSARPVHQFQSLPYGEQPVGDCRINAPDSRDCPAGECDLPIREVPPTCDGGRCPTEGVRGGLLTQFLHGLQAGQNNQGRTSKPNTDAMNRVLNQHETLRRNLPKSGWDSKSIADLGRR